MGIRGVPGRHGGYETFATRFAPYMVERGWDVTVYCQLDQGTKPFEDVWEGVRRVHYAPRTGGTAGTMEFDARTVAHVLRRPGIDLILGYNTAAFNIPQKIVGRRLAMNMDGIEWKRGKWSAAGKAWFFLNEWIGANVCDLLIADHPEIEGHLRPKTRRPIAMIPYGGDAILDAPLAPIQHYGLEPGRYMIKIARPTQENSVLEIVRAFSRARRDCKLMVLGDFDAGNAYHAACRAAASDEVIFPGAIFEPERVSALRFHARAYLHGHTVGGTNPSLCEALGAGNAVIAHDNRFNRWTAGEGQLFFTDEDGCDRAVATLLADEQRLATAQAAARARHAEAFTWPAVLTAYEDALTALAQR